jgi:hypothetical protein
VPEDAEGQSLENRGSGFGYGSAVEHLEWEPHDDGRLWKHTTRWIDVPQTVALTYFALEGIQSLWTVARANTWRCRGASAHLCVKPG